MLHEAYCRLVIERRTFFHKYKFKYHLTSTKLAMMKCNSILFLSYEFNKFV